MKDRPSDVTRKGQVTDPIGIRADWRLKPKDKVVIRPATSTLLAGYGAVAPKHRPEDHAVIREAMEKESAREVGEED